MNIELDFSKITIGDVLPLLKSNVSTADMIVFSDKVVVGGVMHFSVEKLDEIVEKMTPAFIEYMNSIAQNRNDKLILIDMLQGVKGL